MGTPDELPALHGAGSDYRGAQHGERAAVAVCSAGTGGRAGDWASLPACSAACTGMQPQSVRLSATTINGQCNHNQLQWQRRPAAGALTFHGQGRGACARQRRRIRQLGAGDGVDDLELACHLAAEHADHAGGQDVHACRVCVGCVGGGDTGGLRWRGRPSSATAPTCTPLPPLSDTHSSSPHLAVLVRGHPQQAYVPHTPSPG